MRELSYLDFDLLVEPTGPGAYRARVLDAPTGQTAPARFTMPFSDLEVENFLLRIGMPRRQSVRGEHSPEATAVREFGGRLFDAVFHDEVRVALATSLDHAESRNSGLRVRLRLSDCAELADLPWEYLYDRGSRRFLALSEWTPVVRYLEFPGRVRPLPVSPPLRVLVLIASPTDFPRLDVAAEWDKLRQALGAWNAPAGSWSSGCPTEPWRTCSASCAEPTTTCSTISGTAATTSAPRTAC